MQKLLRSLIAVGGLAGLAACGDDVSVTEPPPPPLTISGAPVTAIQVGAKVQLSASEAATWASSAANVASVDATGLVTAAAAGTASITATATADVNRKASVTITVTAPVVRSVTVSPPSATIMRGATQPFAANVDADPGVARTVTWTSSNTAIVTINSTSGVATGVAPGSATVIATSTVGAVTGSAAVLVRDPVPATISISSITQQGGGGTVNLNNVAGTIDVNLNVDPGEQIVTKAEVLIDGAVACFQNLSTAESRDLTIANAFGDEEAAIVSCQINTAAFNATTGVPSYLNGAHTISARALIQGGSQTATPGNAMVLNNINTYLANLSLGGTTASATGANGLAYRRGSLTVTVLPVIYTAGGVTMAAGTVTFGSQACDVSPTDNARTGTLAASGSSFAVTFSQTATAGVGNVTDYEYGAGCTAVETVVLNATDSQGNTLFAGAAPSAASTPGIRLDNRAPVAPVVFENPNGRQGGWVNDAVSFVTTQAASANGMISAAVPDAGVGGVTYAAKAAVSTSTTTVAGTADITNPSTLALSLANQICALFYAQDALGNRSATGTPGCDAGDADNSTTIGVDRAAPIVNYDPGSMADMARSLTPSIGGEFVLAVFDTGTAGIGVSGAIPSRATVTRRDSVNAAVCQFGTVVSSVCTPNAMAQTGVGIYATTITAETRSGYFTFTGTAFDAAGNSTPVASTRVIVHDAVAAPSLALSPAQVSLANNFYNGGVPQTFSSFANDNFDVWKVDYQFTYPGLPADIFYGTGVVNTFNATPLLNTNISSSFTVPFFYRQMQVAGALACPAAVAVSAVAKPTAITGTLFDQGGNTVTTGTAIGANTVVTGSATAYPGTMCAWTDSVSATTIGDGTASPGTTPRTVTVFANALGPTLSFNPVFARVDFYYVVGGRMNLIGTATTPSTIDPNPQGFRQHRYSISWTPGTAFASGGTIVAIGSTANGDALATPASGVITIQP
jgi:hypothetical protein